MTQRREATAIDLSTWPEFDAKVLDAGQRNSFLARRRAIEMYCQHVSINDIENETGIDRSQLYRLLDRCARPHDDGRIFGYRALVAASLSSRLPGYTGSNARDLRRALADPKGNLRLYVSLDELEELLEAAIAAYNATPHNGLNGRTPLGAIEHSLHGGGAMLNWLPAHKRKTLCLMHTCWRRWSRFNRRQQTAI